MLTIPNFDRNKTTNMKFSCTTLFALLAAFIGTSYASPHIHPQSSLRSLKKSDENEESDTKRSGKKDDEEVVISRECELGKTNLG